MDRDIKIFNRPIMDKIHKKNHELHLQRLKNIRRGSCNRTSLSVSGHRQINNKKSALIEEEKKTEIEKHNLILFNKMSKIMHRPDQHQNPNSSYTLHSTKIISNNQRIMEENKNIYHRLETQKPTISNRKLTEERNKNLTLLRFMGKYPNKSAQRIKIDTEGSFTNVHHQQSDVHKKSMSTQHKIPAVQTFQLSHRDEEEEKCQERKLQKNYNSQSAHYKKSASQEHNDDTQQEKKEVGSHRQSRASSSKRRYGNIVLFQARGFVAQKHAAIFFERCYDSYIIRAVFDTPIYGEVSHSIQLNEEAGNNFFSQWNYDYPKIMKALRFHNRQLSIWKSEASKESSSGKKTKYFSSSNNKYKERVESTDYLQF